MVINVNMYLDCASMESVDDKCQKLFCCWTHRDSRTRELGPCTEVEFDKILSGGFITVVLVNPPDVKLSNRTSALCSVGLIPFVFLR